MNVVKWIVPNIAFTPQKKPGIFSLSVTGVYILFIQFLSDTKTISQLITN
jgi:hypothetical protein